MMNAIYQPIMGIISIVKLFMTDAEKAAEFCQFWSVAGASLPEKAVADLVTYFFSRRD